MLTRLLLGQSTLRISYGWFEVWTWEKYLPFWWSWWKRIYNTITICTFIAWSLEITRIHIVVHYYDSSQTVTMIPKYNSQPWTVSNINIPFYCYRGLRYPVKIQYRLLVTKICPMSLGELRFVTSNHQRYSNRTVDIKPWRKASIHQHNTAYEI